MSDKSLNQSIEELEAKIKELSTEVTRLKLNEGRYLVANASIPPGIACKFAYDSNGLILRGSSLEASDIPELQMSQISGLEKAIGSIVSEADLKSLREEIKNNSLKRSNTIEGTATKVNFDANGFIVSGSSLLADDIPKLPMSKIEGLPDFVAIIESMSSPVATNVEEKYDVKAGTFTKVSVDTTGRVTAGSQLTMNDLPVDLINKINELGAILPDLAPRTTLEGILTSINKKVEKNAEIAPGEFTKVTVDSKGLVTKGDQLRIQDLPEITIDDITGLRGELNETAKYSDIADLNDSVSTILNSISNIGDINAIKTEVSLKASADSVERMSKEFTSMKDLLSTLQEKIPNELILEQLESIQSELSTLSGRIAVLENKILDQ